MTASPRTRLYNANDSAPDYVQGYATGGEREIVYMDPEIAKALDMAENDRNTAQWNVDTKNEWDGLIAERKAELAAKLAAQAMARQQRTSPADMDRFLNGRPMISLNTPRPMIYDQTQGQSNSPWIVRADGSAINPLTKQVTSTIGSAPSDAEMQNTRAFQAYLNEGDQSFERQIGGRLINDAKILAENYAVGRGLGYVFEGGVWAFGAVRSGKILGGISKVEAGGSTVRVTQYYDPSIGEFPIDGRFALHAEPSLGNRLVDGIRQTTTWVLPKPANEISQLDRLLTGVGQRRYFVEFDVNPSNLMSPSGLKAPYSSFQNMIKGKVDLTGANPVYGTHGFNYLDASVRYGGVPVSLGASYFVYKHMAEKKP